MARDFGSGVTYDDLVGLTAMAVNRIHLPNEDLGTAIHKASQILIEMEFGHYLLLELWGDGHTVWQTGERGRVVVVSATGQLLFKQD